MRPSTLLILSLVALSCGGSDPHPQAADGGGLDAAVAPPPYLESGHSGNIAAAGAAGGAVDGGAPLADASTPEMDAASDSGKQPSSDAGDAGMGDAGPMNDAAPPGPEPLADCAPSSIDFNTAAPGISGDVEIDLSAWLQPVGVRERAYVAVLDAQGHVDSSYNGALHWTLPQGSELVDSPALVAGEGYVTFRFHQPGTWRLAATLDHDTRQGDAGVIVYATQLPIWELQVDEAAFEGIVAQPDANTEIPGNLSIAASVHPARVRLHGASSRYFPKKSLRVELDDPGPVTGTYGKKLLLRAEYNDKTLLRNWLAFRMFFAGTHIPTPRSKLVHLRINDRYYGVMHNVERIDDRLLDRWSLPRNGSMYEADPIDARANPGANLTPLDAAAYPEVYQHQSGAIDYTDLRMLIEDTLSLPDAALAKVIESTVALDDYIDYLAMMAAIQNVDHVRKNYYLYRDPAASRGWQVLPWDLDLSFGHLWSMEQDVLDETINTDSDIFVGEQIPERGGFYNQLITRVLDFPDYRARFQQRVGQLLSQVVTRERAQADVQRMLRCAAPDIAADLNKRASNQEYLQRVSELGDFLDARAQYVQSLPP